MVLMQMWLWTTWARLDAPSSHSQKIHVSRTTCYKGCSSACSTKVRFVSGASAALCATVLLLVGADAGAAGFSSASLAWKIPFSASTCKFFPASERPWNGGVEKNGNWKWCKHVWTMWLTWKSFVLIIHVYSCILYCNKNAQPNSSIHFLSICRDTQFFKTRCMISGTVCHSAGGTERLKALPFSWRNFLAATGKLWKA